MGRTVDEVDYMTIDLQGEHEIKKIVIHNRTSCCQHRAIGLKIQILNEANEVVAETPVIQDTKDTYTYTFLEDTQWK